MKIGNHTGKRATFDDEKGYFLKQLMTMVQTCSYSMKNWTQCTTLF